MRVIATDQNAKLKLELAGLDIDICEKHYEITRLQNELDALEHRHHELLTQLRGGAV
jgi:hypothetical protein